MSRLIDADSLIEVMTEVYKKHYAGDVSASGFTIAMEMVRKQPTAYDVEKVVAELEEKKDEASIEAGKRSVRIGEDEYEADLYYEGKKHAYGHAIEMVRKGGAE